MLLIIAEASIYLYLSTLHETIDNLTQSIFLFLVLHHSPTQPQPKLNTVLFYKSIRGI